MLQTSKGIFVSCRPSFLIIESSVTINFSLIMLKPVNRLNLGAAKEGKDKGKPVRMGYIC